MRPVYSPLTLAFQDPALEREFQRDYFEKSIWHARGAILLVIVLYAVFGVLDSWIVPDIKETAWVIRYAVVCPLAMAVLALSFTRGFERWMQALLSTMYLIGCLGIIVMIAIAQPPGSHLYYAGLLLGMTFGFTVLRLRFAHATATTLVIGAVFEICSIWLQDMPLPVLINNNFFFLSALILGVLGGYNIELHIRRDFVQRRAAEQAVERLRALGDIGRAVSSTLDLGTVLTTIISRADQVSGTDGGAIYEEQHGKLHLRATQDFPPELVDALRAQPLEKGQGVVGRAAVQRQPVAIPDIDADRELDAAMRERLTRYGFHAALALPLQREDDLLGGLVLVRKSPGPFTPQTIDLVQSFATQSALAIHNARLFREIEAQSKALEAASRHKSEFLAHMSHELRTPLNAIIGFSEVLRERLFGDLNAKQADYIADIHSSGHHLLSLINDILDLSKIEAGRMELDLATFSIPQALANALVLIRERAARHGVRLDLKVDEDVGEYRGDERKFKQIMLNLLSNAVKFTPTDGQVSVHASCSDRQIRIAVRDTGVGIAPADQAALFEAFRQVGNDRTRKAEGTGLGLALTRKLIELHGGTIQVKSEAGKGSCFTISLPLTAAEPKRALAAPRAAVSALPAINKSAIAVAITKTAI
jgi:signal transduction histidine kinase